MSSERGRSSGLGYAAGNFGKSLQNTTLGLIYLYFLVDVLGVPAPLAGAILLLSQLWECVTDPILGHLLDRGVGSRRGYNKIILYSLPLSALSFIALFWLPSLADDWTSAWILVSCMVFRLAYALVDVPHNALLAAISTNSRKRSELSALRFFFSSAGSLAALAFAAPALQARQDPSAFITFAILLAILYCPIMAGSVLLTPTIAPRSISTHRLDFRSVLRDLWRNHRLLRIFLIGVISAALLTMFSRMTAFYAKSWVGNAEFASWLLGTHFIGQIVAAPAWSILAVRFEKRTAAWCAHLLMMLVALGFLVVRPSALATGIFFYFWAGVALSGLTIMNWALVPDCIEYTETQAGARHEATTFGIYTALNKVASGVGMAFIGWALHLSGYNAGAEDAGAQSLGLLWAMTLPALIGALACVLLLSRLPMSHAEHGAMERTVTDNR